MRFQNQALIMKNLFKFYNRKDVPWVDLVWKAHYPNCTLPLAPVGYLDHFGGKTVCSLLINSRKLLLAMHTLVILFCFWGDKWSHELFHDKFPQLHSFAKNSSLTIQQARQHANEDLCELFHLPVSVIAANQGQELHDILAHMDDQENDMWTFSWEGDRYKTTKVYESFFDQTPAAMSFKWIWKSVCLSKQKFFFWLLLQDRLSTKDLRARKNFYVEYNRCVLCDSDTNETHTASLFLVHFQSRVFGGNLVLNGILIISFMTCLFRLPKSPACLLL